MTAGAAKSGPPLYSYRAFGLQISSDLPLPGVPKAREKAPVDVHFQLCSDGPPEEAAVDCWRLIHEVPDPDGIGGPVIAVDQSPDVGLCRVSYVDGHRYYLPSDGSRVWACPPSSAHSADTVSYLLGPILGLLLRLRGSVVLHASAVVVDSNAVALLGPSGAGKSTLAARLTSLGHRLITDDLLPLMADGDDIHAQPGYGRIRLWADSARALAPADTELPPVSPSWDKKYLDPATIGSGFAEGPLPIRVIYLLMPRQAGLAETLIEPISARDATVQLLANTFAAPLVPPHLRVEELQILGRVAEGVPVREVTMPDMLSAYAATTERLLRDVAAISPIDV